MAETDSDFLVTPQSHGPVNAVKVAALDLPVGQNPQSAATSPLTNDTPASSTSISVGVDGETFNPNTFLYHVESVQPLVESSSIAPRPITTTSRLNLQTPEGKPSLTDGASQIILSLATETQPGLKATLTNGPRISSADAESTKLPALIIGSQTVRPDDRDRFIPMIGQTLTPGSTTTLGLSISTTIPGLRISSSQTSFVTGPNTSLLSSVTAAPALSKTPTVLTIGGHAMTADSLGHYNINDQTPRSGGAITISGSIMSLTPNKSDVLVATHTGNLGANFSTGFASGPKVTGVQTFEGNALGARDGLCSSSMLTLIGIAILLWFG